MRRWPAATPTTVLFAPREGADVRRESVESSVIRSVGYERSTATLEIEFHSDKVYRYFAVPHAIFEGLISAESVGAFFNERVRDRYPEERVSR